jgi:bifunctional DNA-binding transcriptional regulator/antitoxin component of YhaV-PrlF toxin-antitoxin module
VYKQNGRLTITLPPELVRLLDIKDGDDVDFLRYSDRSYIFAKTKDLLARISTGPAAAHGPQEAAPVQQRPAPSLSVEELALLKKLDRVKYDQRTSSKVNATLSDQERKVLQRLIDRRVIALMRKGTSQDFAYSISKDVYNRYLYGKRGMEADKELEMLSQHSQQPVPKKPVPGPKTWEMALSSKEENVKQLESEGFIVLSTEAEATELASAIEESIHQGQVVGQRAFKNRKFYVALRSYVNKISPRVLKVLSDKRMSVAEIAAATDTPEDGVRAVLYILADSGDVIEKKSDIFARVE